MKSALPTFADVLEASEKLQGIVRKTPLLNSPEIDKAVGRKVYFKCEPLQHTGSFKLRGAYNRLCRLQGEQRDKGVVAYSSGNHAQGVARSARLLGMPAVIVMPSDAPKTKVAGVRRDAAEIVFYDRYTESREAIAAEISSRTGAVIVPSYDDFHIIAGQGSCGVEITEQWPEAEPPVALICGVGGGGLISGISLATHEVWPSLEIMGAEPEGFDDCARSLKAGLRLGNDPEARSICDALLSPSTGVLTFDIIRDHLSGVCVVSDAEVGEAVRMAAQFLKLTVEPGGCVSLAALLSGKADDLPEGPVVAVLTGGNVDPDVFAKILTSAL